MSNSGYDPLTFMIVDTGRLEIISGESNDYGCFGVEETCINGIK